jgi:arylamine N-acetyltransferase
MDVSESWLRRYLDLLGVERSRPSLGALAALTRAQVRTVTFENVTSLVRHDAHRGGPTPPLDPEAVLEGWQLRRGGGVCFEVTELFGTLLAALGYRVHPVLGQISFPGSHRALLVELDGARLLVDAGNGAPFLEPIALDQTIEVRRAGLAYRFRPDSGTCVQERWIDGAWTQFCRYALRPASPAERDAAYRRHHTPGESFVLGSVTLIRCDDEQVVVLRDDQLTRFTPAGKRNEAVTTDADYARLAAEQFGLPGLPIGEGVRAWRRNVAAAPRRVTLAPP